MKPGKHLDEQIREKMENLEADFDPASWNLLAHRMDFEAQEAVDDLFKDRLAEVNAPLAPNSWEAMEQLIEADEAAELIEKEAPIDNIAFEKLRHLQVPYSDSHWALMAKRLEEEFSLRHLLYRYKVAEITLMALLLLTIIRFIPLMDEWMPQSSSNNQTPAYQQSPILPAEETTPATEWQILDMAVNGTTPNAAIASGHNATTRSLIPSVRSDAAGLPLDRTALNATRSKWQGRYLSLLPNKELTATEATTAEQTKTILEAFDAKQDKLLAINRRTITQPDDVATMPIQPVEGTFDWEVPAVKISPVIKKSDLRFSIFTTTDLNYVTTPPNQVSVFGEPVQTDLNKLLAIGYGGGITVSWKRDRWEYQTGGVYSFKRYIPNTPKFIFGTINFYIQEDFNGIQLDIFQLPLNALYHFKNTGKWHFYASAGASAHFITSTIYEIDHEKRALDQSGPPGQGSPDDNKSIKNAEGFRFPTGLLDGGTLNDNLYMTANLGLGVERYLSPKWTIFFQPNYQHFFGSDGIGDNRDKVYTTSFYLGTKFNLK